MSTQLKNRSTIVHLGLLLAVLAALFTVGVGTAGTASAGTTPRCTNTAADQGFGVRRYCQYDTTANGSRVNGAATWYYNSGGAANTGRISAFVQDADANGRCAYALVGSTTHGGYWYEACGYGNKKQIDVDLGLGTSAPRIGTYYIKVCGRRIESTCGTVWSQRIGQAPPF